MTTSATMRKTVVITGATGGVGRGIAIACGEAGWEVWIAARRKAEGECVAGEVDAAGGRGRFVSCDVGLRESVDAAIDTILEKSGGLDGIVHNATSDLSPVPADLSTISAASLRNHIDVALRGAYLLARRGFAPLRERRGCFLLLTSEAGFERKAKLAPYAGDEARLRAPPGAGRPDPPAQSARPAGRCRHRHRASGSLPALRRRELRHRPHPDGGRR